jgi:hypothetical protein
VGLRIAYGLLLPAWLLAQAPALDRARLASQAQSFAEQLPNLIGSETLRQKSIQYATRMRIRFGEAALKPIPPKVTERAIRSEMGFALRGKEQPVWYELRKVIDVDGRTVNPPKKARERLAFGLKSDNERERLRMMEEFSRFGLNGLAADYSLSLLLFRFGEVDKFRFDPAGQEFIGADRVHLYRFSRPDDAVGVTVFDGKQVSRQPLEGKLWVGAESALPLRLQLNSRLTDGPSVIEDTGVISYEPSRFGTVLPVSVLYQRHINGAMVMEIRYEYSNFQKFGADAELKFTP